MLSKKHNSTGVMNDRGQLNACETSNARAVPKPSLIILLAATGSKSVEVAEVRGQPDVNLTNGIENPVIPGVHDNGCLGADPQV